MAQIALEDLEVGCYYRNHEARWIVLDKEPILDGFKITYTTVENGVIWKGKPYTDSTSRTWDVELDFYIIEEEHDRT